MKNIACMQYHIGAILRFIRNYIMLLVYEKYNARKVKFLKCVSKGDGKG